MVGCRGKGVKLPAVGSSSAFVPSRACCMHDGDHGSSQQLQVPTGVEHLWGSSAFPVCSEVRGSQTREFPSLLILPPFSFFLFLFFWLTLGALFNESTSDGGDPKVTRRLSPLGMFRPPPAVCGTIRPKDRRLSRGSGSLWPVPSIQEVCTVQYTCKSPVSMG